MKRGFVSIETGLVFWRMSRGSPYWVTIDEFKRLRIKENERKQRFFKNHKNYVPFSHTKEESLKRNKQYRNNNKDKRSESFKKWFSLNKQSVNAYNKKRYLENDEVRSSILARNSLRRSMCKKGSASFEVKFLYSFSKALSQGGVKHVVDHIMPINPSSKKYCGLTNHCNLRVIPEKTNLVKKNKCPLSIK